MHVAITFMLTLVSLTAFGKRVTTIACCMWPDLLSVNICSTPLLYSGAPQIHRQGPSRLRADKVSSGRDEGSGTDCQRAKEKG